MSVLFTRRGAAPALGKLASDYAVGESVFLNVNGTAKEFLVVHQGKPSSLYDDSCDGTWLLMKDVYTESLWASSYVFYQGTNIHTYLNDTFLNLLGSEVQAAVKQVKIPHQSAKGVLSSGANGLSTKVFILSHYELGVGSSYIDGKAPLQEGTQLEYFSSNDSRIAYMNGELSSYFSRSSKNGDPAYVGVIGTAGTTWLGYHNTTGGVRPALILPSTTYFDPETNTIK